MEERISPRLLRFEQALDYLSMSRHSFNLLVRPTVRVIKIGKRGVAFDRADLDAWIQHTKKQDLEANNISYQPSNTKNAYTRKKTTVSYPKKYSFEKSLSLIENNKS